MSEEKKSDDFVNITDCLEAVGVFKSMKNFIFVIVFLCIIILGACFWLADLGLVKNPDAAKAAIIEEFQPVIDAVAAEPNSVAAAVAKAVEKVTADPNAIVAKQPEHVKAKSSAPKFQISYSIIERAVRTCNFVLIISASLYCLVLMFCLKVSLVGRLGGINHIARAFFSSLFVLAFIFPWQKLLGTSHPIVIGAIYLPHELKAAMTNKETFTIIASIFYYIRFVFWWVIVILLLLASQRRSAKWANATLRRLGIEQ